MGNGYSSYFTGEITHQFDMMATNDPPAVHVSIRDVTAAVRDNVRAVGAQPPGHGPCPVSEPKWLGRGRRPYGSLGLPLEFLHGRVRPGTARLVLSGHHGEGNGHCRVLSGTHGPSSSGQVELLFVGVGSEAAQGIHSAKLAWIWRRETPLPTGSWCGNLVDGPVHRVSAAMVRRTGHRVAANGDLYEPNAQMGSREARPLSDLRVRPPRQQRPMFRMRHADSVRGRNHFVSVSPLKRTGSHRSARYVVRCYDTRGRAHSASQAMPLNGMPNAICAVAVFVLLSAPLWTMLGSCFLPMERRWDVC